MPMSLRTHTFQIGVEFVVEDCCNCGVGFALTAELRERKLKDKTTFYCPNGHPQSYVGQSDAAKIRELERDRDWYKDAERRAADDRDLARRSAAAYKGQTTKLRQRAITGSCAFCHRHFANVERHVASQHPGETPEATE